MERMAYTRLPDDRCSQVNHHVRNGLVAVVYYMELVMDHAQALNRPELIKLAPQMRETITRLEGALRMCRGCERCAGCTIPSPTPEGQLSLFDVQLPPPVPGTGLGRLPGNDENDKCCDD